jgi:hypothetical protein
MITMSGRSHEWAGESVEMERAKMLKLIGNALMWASIVIAIGGIAYFLLDRNARHVPSLRRSRYRGVCWNACAMSVPTPTTFALTVMDGRCCRPSALSERFGSRIFSQNLRGGRLSAPVLCRDH